MKLLKIKPFFSERIWGGKELLNMGFAAPIDKNIGEAWVISAHENGMGFIEGGEFNNQSLKNVFENNRNLFGNFQGEFPLLVKIIAANDFLSVQVHPNDEYALKKHNSLGKPESWYILDCPKDANLIYGHTAKTKEQLLEMIKNKKWDQLLTKVKIDKGDFLYVPPGKVHAITPGVVVCEIQRSSDVTYRMYDYDRIDDKGNARELHIEDSIENVEIPDKNSLHIKNANKLIFNSDYFSVYKLDSNVEKTFVCPEKTGWLQMTVINGNGTINNISCKSGDSFIAIDKLETIKTSGDIVVLISWIRGI